MELAAPADPPVLAGRQPRPALLSPIVLEWMPGDPDRRLSPVEWVLFPSFRIRQALNRASGPALAAIPGLGPKTAAAIVRHREEHGPFRHRAELLDVRGIGWHTYLGMIDFITLDGVLAVGAHEPEP